MVYLVFSAVRRKLEMYLGMVATHVNKILQKHNNHSKCLRIFKRKENIKTVRFAVVFWQCPTILLIILQKVSANEEDGKERRKI